jgi:hypothetical protein
VAFLIIVLMVGLLLGAVVLSKGRNFFKYAEMSRTLQSQDDTAVRTRHRAAQ